MRNKERIQNLDIKLKRLHRIRPGRKKNRRYTFRYLLGNLLIAYFCLFLCRLIFIAVNNEYFPDLTFGHLLELFRGGMRFDLTSLLYLNGIYIVMILFPCHWKENSLRYQQTAKWVYIVFNSIGILMNLMDTVYFQYTNRRTTASVFSEFSHENNLMGIIGTELINHWYLTLAAATLIYFLYKAYRMPGLRKIRIYEFYYPSYLLMLAIAVPLCVFGIRGGIGAAVRPITLSNANQYADRPVETAIVLNTPFSIIRTIGKKPFVTPDYFKDEALLEQIFTPVHLPADSIGQFKPLNVVVFILESFGKEYFGSLNPTLEGGHYKGYTPFLDSLINHSLTFEYSFANGRKSIDGMPSVLSSIPMFVEPFFSTPAALNKVSGIAGELDKKGYYTAFFHGAENGSMGFEAFSRATGFKDYYGRTEYNNDSDFDGRWAIWDEEFLQFYANTMSGFRQPFCTTVFTASSHHPFIVQERYKNVFPEGTLPIHKCIRYSDYALKRFFETASRQPWFDNTLFVITADHTNQTEYPEYQTESGLYAVPVIFYSPGDSLKGHVNAIAQQIDIMPTVLGYLNYDLPYVAFGCNLLDTPASDTYAVNYVNGTYQYFKGDYLLQFNGYTSVALYKFKEDKLLKNNLVGQESAVCGQMETELKAIIQQYMKRMNNDELVVSQ